MTPRPVLTHQMMGYLALWTLSYDIRKYIDPDTTYRARRRLLEATGVDIYDEPSPTDRRLTFQYVADNYEVATKARGRRKRPVNEPTANEQPPETA